MVITQFFSYSRHSLLLAYCAAVFSFLCFSLSLEAQNAEGEKYWVFFKDKQDSAYSLDKPEAFLSKRALERRARFGIALTESDLPVNQRYLSALSDLNLQLGHPSKWLNASSVVVQNPDQVQAILELDFVTSVRPVGRHIGEAEEPLAAMESVMSLELVDEALPEGQTYFGEGFGQLEMVCGTEFQLRGYTGEGVLIAVMDAGFPNLENFDFYENLLAQGRLIEGFDFVDNDNTIYEDHKHGRNVFSIMAADLPGKLIGAAPDASYVLYRTEDVATEKNLEEDNWIAAAEEAESIGADIFNTSLGYSEFDDGQNSYTYADLDGNTALITKAADMAASKGVLVVNSAGNEGNGSWRYVTAPADGDSVLAVGAVDYNRVKMGFSSFGPTVDGRVKPNVMAWGGQTAYLNASGEVERGNGTSYASPVIAGMAACLMQANPNKSNMEIFAAIERSCDHYFSPSDSLGYGVPNFCLAHRLLNWSKNTDRMTAFPNPMTDQIRLMFEGTEGEEIFFELYDLTGRIHGTFRFVCPRTGTVEAGFEDMDHLSPGFYAIRMIGSDRTLTTSVYKQ